MPMYLQCIDDFVIVEYVKGLILNASEESDYQSRVAGIVDEMVNKERLVVALTKECLHRVSPYDYERMYLVTTSVAIVILL